MALRASVLRRPPYGPIGGLPGVERIDQDMPNHTREIEVFDAKTGAHLGTGNLADQPSTETRRAVRRARDRKARQLRSDLAAAERARHVRYAAVTTRNRRSGRDTTVTTVEGGRVLAEDQADDLARYARARA
ncbi:hypothetical protein CRH09_26695 [Nocardia terpenica]|uniref:Uncharacterized protein n=1 Tax=Nocardia terpenica TaxID=455432 RepID=A0A291RPY6_9NOCA|nr:hypothetical protein CRH09_26695 [Nocardia terpenica]